MNFPFPVHLAWVPIDLLTITNPVIPKAPWFEELKADIEQRGLASPLLVSNGVAEPLVKQIAMRVLTGNNRLKCLKLLGWERVPCIVVGTLPEGVEGRKLKDLEEAQGLLGDGLIAYAPRQNSLRINSAICPEQRRFPKAERRYRKEDGG